jgi:hypothetical protein
MARTVIYVVYVLPVVFSLIFGSIVMTDILQEPGRELNLLRVGSIGENSHDEPIEIIGLEKQYSISEPVQIQVIVNDLSFSCGDLYVTIYTSGKENAVTQSGYFEQCFDDDIQFLPVKEKFSEIVDTPGRYELVVDILDKNQKNSITTSEEFTVK